MYITYIIDYYMSITGSLEEENLNVIFLVKWNNILFKNCNDTLITLFIIVH